MNTGLVTKNIKTFTRTTEGLRDALLSEIEDVMCSISSPAEAEAIAGLAGCYIETLQLDAMKVRDEYRREQERQEQEREARLAQRADSITVIPRLLSTV